jgi:hypothetical protein
MATPKPAGPLGSLTPCNLVTTKKSSHDSTARQIFETIPADPGCARETASADALVYHHRVLSTLLTLNRTSSSSSHPNQFQFPHITNVTHETILTVISERRASHPSGARPRKCYYQLTFSHLFLYTKGQIPFPPFTQKSPFPPATQTHSPPAVDPQKHSEIDQLSLPLPREVHSGVKSASAIPHSEAVRGQSLAEPSVLLEAHNYRE